MEDTSAFPGLYRPGLIEAVPHRLPLLQDGQFPGLYRPGLIEASVMGVSSQLGCRGFRGFTAPASLKRAGGERTSRTTIGFRGFTAPASLKPLCRACSP